MDYSLCEDTPKKVISYHMLFSKDFNYQKMYITADEITVDKNYTFDNINKIYLKNMYDENHFMTKLMALANSFNFIYDIRYSDYGDYFNTKMMAFLNNKFSEYCYQNNIPYINKFNVFDKKDDDVGVLDEVYDNKYLFLCYYISNYERIKGKISTPLRDYVSYINQIITNHYIFNDNITLEADIKIKDSIFSLVNFINDTNNKDKKKIEEDSIKNKQKFIKYNKK